eukprot:TRINITY_DN3998_c4_g1_i1.p1 TRINITY_DN3998_c4_g1~~TRINITY_DN3998_c4_g1_i1.p1  ORF type:complete len:290 (+),score=76.05 TRINITY_DN3998_c4_g1_i1:28-870(+)
MKRKVEESTSRLPKEILESNVLDLYDWDEWCNVMEWLYSEDEEEVTMGVERVGVWRSGVGTNIAIDGTAGLMKARMQDSKRRNSIEKGVACHIDSQDLQVQYSTTIIRLVNGLTSEVEAKTGKMTRTVRQMAADILLPSELVDVRHAATHKALPQLPELRIAAALALSYLYKNYWLTQQQDLLQFTRQKRRNTPTPPPSFNTIHPYLLDKPVPVDTHLTLGQLQSKLDTECPKGIEHTLSKLEKELDIKETDTLWPVSGVTTEEINRRGGVHHAAKYQIV